MNHIPITDIQGIRFGNAENQQAIYRRHRRPVRPT